MHELVCSCHILRDMNLLILWNVLEAHILFIILMLHPIHIFLKCQLQNFYSRIKLILNLNTS